MTTVDVLIMLWLYGLAMGAAAAPLVVAWLLFRHVAALAHGEAMRFHAQLAEQLASPPAEDSVGAEQAVSDALACYDAATRHAMTATKVAEWELVGLLCRLGLGFLVPFSAHPLPAPPAASPWVGTSRSFSQRAATPTPSVQPTDQTPYYHPGGVVDGQHVQRGWYPTPWWSDSLRSGPYRLHGGAPVVIAAAR